MERGKGKWESAWDTGQYHGGVEGQKKSKIVYFLEVKGNGEEGNSINHGSWGPTRCATIILCERSPVSLEKSNFSYTPGMASCSRHEAAFGHLPDRCSLKALEKTGTETPSAFNSAHFLKWMCRYVWLYQLSTRVLRSISKTNSAQKLTKGLQGTLDKCSPLKKLLGTAIKRKDLCYLGVCDAFTGGPTMTPLLLFWKLAHHFWLWYSDMQGWVPAPSLQSSLKAASSW